MAQDALGIQTAILNNHEITFLISNISQPEKGQKQPMEDLNFWFVEFQKATKYYFWYYKLKLTDVYS